MDRRTLLISGAGIALGLAPFVAAAQAAPGGPPLRLIVPYAPGGPIDVTARLLAEQVRGALGTVIVDNKPGAGGNIGADLVAKAAPDGHTIGIAATATHAVNPWLYARMPYDAARDFAPITQMVSVPNVLVMNAEKARQLRIETLADLVRYAKRNPARLNYGSGGNGSAGHLAGELFKARAGIFAVHIPYNGSAPALNALLAGEVEMMFDLIVTATPHVKAGKANALVITTRRRSPLLPDVLSVDEAGLRSLELSAWFGLFAPAGLPADLTETLARDGEDRRLP
jgi:tripartite-type tricarboxylate transporter receptor subunit TctC